MKVVIAGGGNVGSALAARLVAANHQVTVIERDRAIADQLFEEVGAVTVCGDATDPRTLEAAGIGSADIAAAMLARDADNMAFTMLCRARSNARVMVRQLDERYTEAYQLAGARDVINEAEVVVAKIVTSIEFPDVGGLIPLPGGEVILFELPVGERALVAGKTVQQVRAEPGFPRDCVFIAVVDPDGQTELPTGATVLKPQHVAIMVAKRDQLSHAVDFLTAEPGADSEAARSVAQALRRIDFLKPLDERELADLSRGIGLRRYGDGETIFRKGDEGDSFYLVLAAEVVVLNEAGKVVETVRTGGFFGEIALLTGEPRAATARSVGNCELVAIGRADFQRVVMANPSLALEMSRILGKRLADAARAEPPRKRGLFGL